MRKSVLYLIICFLSTVLAIQATSGIEKEVNFAFLTDIHVKPGAASEKALLTIIKEINASTLDFVVLTGDLTNTGSNAELNAVKEAMSQLKINYYVIPGNHETNWSESAGQTFIKLFGSDRFCFEYDKYLFVGFATGPYMKMGDGHSKEEDIHWLQQTLKTRMSSDKMLIVASHYPLKDGLDNWYKLTGLLRPYQPGMVLCGHEHRLSLHNFDGITGVMGRPTFYSKDTIGGYNIVTLKNDSAFIFEKRTGITPKVLFSAFSLKNNDKVKDLPTSKLPDYSINPKYLQIVNPKEVIQDSASIFTGIAVKDKSIIYGNSKGEVIAWDYAKDQLKWRKQFTGSIFATPTIVDQTVIVGDSKGLYALDIQNGKEQWNLGQLNGPVIGDAATDRDFIFQSAGNTLYKIDVKSGKISWLFDADGQLQGRPAIDEKSIIFGAWDRHLYCLDKSTGQLRWKWDNGNAGILYSPGNVVPAISHNKVFIVAPDRYMTAIDLHTGQTIWRTNKHQVRESMGISEEGNAVYAKLMNDSIIAISTIEDTYKENWTLNAGFGYEHNPCPILEHKGIIYAGGKNGLLVAIDKQSKEVAFQYKAGNSSINQITPDPKEGVWITLIEGKILWIKPSLSSQPQSDEKDVYGAIIRKNKGEKSVYLIFSADKALEGAPIILQTLNKHNIKASFFLTGNCLRSKTHEKTIREIIKSKHYIGGHSDNHLLYAPWDNRQQSLVSPDSLIADFKKNMKELSLRGIDTSQVNHYLPPFEWYNSESVKLIESQGQNVINYTPGIPTAADYTTPDMKNYKTSQQIIDKLYALEEAQGLNGAIILIHPGTVPERTDKLYLRLDEIIGELKQRGYSLNPLTP